MKIIELKDVCKSYNGKKILNKLSMDINKGDFVAIMGSSGRGKSTLLNIIGLLEEFDSGNLIIKGKKDIKINSKEATRVLREDISYLFQNFALIDNETVNYNLSIALKYVKVPKDKKEKLIKEALQRVGLDGSQKRKIYELSGGEQQRIAIARVILKPSEIILADEPTGSLDEKNRSEIVNLLKSLNREGKTIIIVTHDRFVAEECERVISL